MRLFRMLFAAVGATMMFGALVGIASARTITYSESRLTARFARVEFSGAGGTTRCNLTLSRVFHSRTISKVLESLVGLITEASVGGCDPGTGSATILRETLPWHLRYNGFSGTLPNITAIQYKVVGFAYRVREPGSLECLVTTTAGAPIITRSGATSGVNTAEEVEGTFNCFFISSRVRGTTLTSGGSVSPVVTVTLI